MLGYGTIGQFTIGQVAAASGELVAESKWHQPWSEPLIKIKVGLRTGSQQFLAMQPLLPLLNRWWLTQLSEPVRIKPAVLPGLQQFYTGDTEVIPFNKDLRRGWFASFRDPVRFKPGLSVALQQFFFANPRLIPKPNVTITILAPETNSDAAIIAVNVLQSQAAASAVVSIVEVSAGSVVSIQEVVEPWKH